ncbi:MAG: polysaccharide deacetylase [Bdellovibrionales bacterium CG10_big_fil_rev_8_21_14_0_10_45_34]|nr:MAG: polysaccharide deacetylase [Bdellovibrionales bacterium CG10_big_fil_rev_8_21_14_0_10_45_34]
MFRSILIVILLISHSAFAKKLAITFDDSPRHAKGHFDGRTRAKKLIKNLKKHNAGDVVFFSVSGQIDKEGRERLQKYADAGHTIANHTATHPNFNETAPSEYKDNFEKAHNVLKEFSTFKKWFRFPYLREGNTKEKRDGMRSALRDMSYRNAYITLNNYDWYIETIFQRAVKSPNFNFDKMRDFYVNVLVESVEYYDKMAVEHLGRSPKHVLLLHEMDISALFIGDLIEALRKNGWQIISTENAYTDEIANYETQAFFPFNPGRIGEIAKDKGQTNGLWHESCDEQYLEERFKREVLP